MKNLTLWRKLDHQSCPKVMNLLSNKVDIKMFQY